jgi:hypothetical protein
VRASGPQLFLRPRSRRELEQRVLVEVHSRESLGARPAHVLIQYVVGPAVNAGDWLAGP